MNNIVVLGGSGFLGAHIIKALQKASVGDVAYGDIVPNRLLNCDYIKLDILDINDIIYKLKNYNIIINCIGQITQPFNLCFKLNSIGISNLAKAMSGLDVRLIHISTVAVYGSLENCNEESPLNPETSYATAKACAEQILLENYNKENIAILRLANLYGSHQMKGVVTYLLQSYHSDRKLNFNNDGKLTRSFLHVEDCANIVTAVVTNSKVTGIFNVKGHETFSVMDLVQEFETHFKVTFEKCFSQDLPWENIDNLDDSKLRSTIVIQPRWHLFDFIGKELGKKVYA